MFFYKLITELKRAKQKYYLLIILSLLFLPKITLAQRFQVVNPLLSSVQSLSNAQSANFKVEANMAPFQSVGSSNNFLVSGSSVTDSEINEKIPAKTSSKTRGKYDASGWILKRKYDQLVQDSLKDDFLTSAPKLGKNEDDDILEWMKEFTLNLEANTFNENKKLEFASEEDEFKNKLWDIKPNFQNLETIEFEKDSITQEENKVVFTKDKPSSILLALQKFWEEGAIPEYLNGQQKLVFAQSSQYIKEDVLNGNFEFDDSGIPIFLDKDKKVAFEDFTQILREHGSFIIDESEKFGGTSLVFEKTQKNNSQKEENLYFNSAPKIEEELDMSRFKLTDEEKKSLVIKKQYRAFKENPNELDIWKESADKLLNILILLTIFQFIAGGLVVRFLYKKNHRVKKFLRLYSPKK